MTTLTPSLRKSPLLVVGVCILVVLIVVGVLAPWIAPHDPRAITGDVFESPSSEHLLGTNEVGTDNFSRLIMGGRTTLRVAGGATALILAIGLAMGLTAGLRGGLLDIALMRVVDVVLALPTVPLLMLVSSLTGPSLTVSILMIGLITWPETARIVRSQTLSLRTRGFVGVARAFGAGPLYMMRRHLLPTLAPVVGANLVYVAGLAITVEAGLAFLGLGDPTAVSWGTDLNRGAGSSLILLPTGIALTLVLLGLTLIGVGLENRFNPRTDRYSPR